MVNSLKKLIRNMIAFVFSLFPVQNRVVFINFNGRGFGCNPKYIALEMLREQVAAELIWFVHNLNEPLPSGIKKVKWGSLLFYYELATAKVIVTNVKNALPFYKRENQYLVQTWHGSNAYKYVEKEVENQLSPQYIAGSKENSALTDLFISDSPTTSQWYRDSFWCKCEILESGMPRNDILQNGTVKDKERILSSFDLSVDDKVILYAPTFRDDGSMNCYNIKFSKVLSALSEKWPGKWYLLLRLHPNVHNSIKIEPEIADRIINAAEYGDAQELIFASDCLITDYSSICNDFMMMDKPVFLFTSDYEEYAHRGRGLKSNYDELPMPKNKTNQELVETIKKFDEKEYRKAIGKYKNKYFGIADGKASERVVQRIKKMLV